MVILVGTVACNVIDAPFTFLTVYDVIRNQYFYLGDNLSQALPSATAFVINLFAIIEIAEPGAEGLTYGVITTAGSLGGLVSTPLSNWIFGYFHPSLSDAANYLKDDHSFRTLVRRRAHQPRGRDAYTPPHMRPTRFTKACARTALTTTSRTSAWRAAHAPTSRRASWQVACSCILGYVTTLSAMFFLPLMPNQKADAQHRIATRKRRVAHAVIILLILTCGIIYAVTIDMLSIIPATSCLQIAGGQGCPASSASQAQQLLASSAVDVHELPTASISNVTSVATFAASAASTSARAALGALVPPTLGHA